LPGFTGIGVIPRIAGLPPRTRVAMANKTQHPAFRQHLAARGLRAAIAAGASDPAVEFHQPDGSKIIVRAGAKPAAPAVQRPTVRKPVTVAPMKPPRGIRPSR
jgi:hypothetical protein